MQLCKKSFNSTSAVRQHFVAEHNIPENDEVLNRYVQLRFSSNKGDVARKQKVLVRLLKLLKRRGAHNTMNREKVKVNQTQVDKILYAFVNLNDDDVNSVDSGYDQTCWTKLSNIKWFMRYYNVFINKSVSTDNKQNGTMVSFFSSEERQFSQCPRLKIEQKLNVTLDFTDVKDLSGGRKNTDPYECFNSMQRIIYSDFFKNFSNKLGSQFQLLIEMTVEFVKSESSVELEERWENEGNFCMW